MTTRHQAEDKFIIAAEENVILATLAWIDVKYKRGPERDRLGDAIEAHNKILGVKSSDRSKHDRWKRRERNAA